MQEDGGGGLFFFRREKRGYSEPMDEERKGRFSQMCVGVGCWEGEVWKE